VRTPSGVQRFLDATAGLDIPVTEMADSTHTAQEAADAVGAPVAAIVKSLVFLADGDPLLLLVSGPNRVDTDEVGRRLSVTITKADASTVKKTTGYSIGGVPPFGHPTPLRTFIDEDLLVLDQVWAAAGSPQAVFPISPGKLHELSGATPIRVT
jgi:prolyl-tRNA editing enzyme YbaK/EbsC (Cys-tRNA(Pro) deacylase)